MGKRAKNSQEKPGFSNNKSGFRKKFLSMAAKKTENGENGEAGTKKVTRTTREEFIAPVKDDKAAETVPAGEPRTVILPPAPVDDGAEFDDLELPPMLRYFGQDGANGDGNLHGSIIVWRQPDKFNQIFFRPCGVRTKVETVPLDSFADEDELHEYIRNTHYGGNYQFQLRIGKGFDTSQFETLSDPPALIKQLEARSDNAQNTATAPAVAPSAPISPAAEAKEPIDSLDEFIRQANKFKELRKALRDDDDDKQVAPAAAAAAVAPLSLEALLLSQAVSDKTPTAVSDKILSIVVDRIFPKDDEKKAEDGLLPTIKFLVENRGDVGDLVESVGGVTGFLGFNPLSLLQSSRAPIKTALKMPQPKQPAPETAANTPAAATASPAQKTRRDNGQTTATKRAVAPPGMPPRIKFGAAAVTAKKGKKAA
jgi:hypothetical protein